MGILNRKSARLLLAGATATSLLLFSGCGNDSDEPQTGVFQDSAVAGLNYSSPTFGGVTDNAGQFQYGQGEVVSFYLGKLLLGSALGRANVTPLDIVENANGEMTPAVINVLRLLQSLDEDGNTSNGITLPAATKSLTETSIDLSDEAAVLALLQEIDSTLTLISEEVAVAHFEETLVALGETINYTDYLGNTRTAVATAGAAEYHTGTGFGNTMFDSADKKCQNCHNELYDTWKSSMHGKSWTDPVFQSKFQDFLRVQLSKVGSASGAYSTTKFKGVAQTCIKCHAPGAYYAGDVQVSVTELLGGAAPTTADLDTAKVNDQSNMSPFDPSQATKVVSASKFTNKLYQASFQIGHEANQEGINCAFCHSMETMRLISGTGSDGGAYTLAGAIKEGPVGSTVYNPGDTLNYTKDGTNHEMNAFFRLWGPEKYTDPSNTPKTAGNFDIGKAKDGRYTMHSTDLNGVNGKVHFTGGPYYGPFGVSGKSNENATDESNRTANINPDYHKDTNNQFGNHGKALCLSCHQRSAGAIDPTSAGVATVKDVGTDKFMELCSTWIAVTTGTDTNENDTSTSPKCQKCHMERIEGVLLHKWAKPDERFDAASFKAAVGYDLTPELDGEDTTVPAGENPQRDGWLNSHAFLGASKTGHKTSVTAKIKSGFAASLATSETGSTLTVTTTLQNKTGHMFPGAHPMRRTLTRVIVTDANGVMVPYEVTSTGSSGFGTITNTVTPLTGKTLHGSQDATVTLDDGGSAALAFTGKAADLTGAAVGGQKFDGQSVVVIAADGTVKSQTIVSGAIQGSVKNAAIVADTNLSTYTRIYGHETGKMLDPTTGASDPTGTFVVRPGFDSNVVANDTRLSPNETETYTLTYDVSGGAGLTRPLTVTYKVYYMQKGAGGSFPTTADGWLDPAVNTAKKLLITEVHSSTETIQ